MQQAAKDKLAQAEAEQKQKDKAAAETKKPSQHDENEFDEEDDPDFMDDASEKEIMRRMALERMAETGLKKKGTDRQTEGVGKRESCR